MKDDGLRLIVCLVAILAMGIVDYVYADAGCCVASASGKAITAKTPVVNKTLGSSSIGCNGGNKTNTLASASILGLLNTGIVETSATGTTTSTSSHAEVNNLLVTAGLNLITATKISSDAQASCGGNAAGSSIVLNLSVNGQAVNVTGQPNQEVPIPGGKLIINEQKVKSSGGGCVKNITVTALKISLLGVADVSLATSQAGVACVTFSCS
jgi:hypothetical protein